MTCSDKSFVIENKKHTVLVNLTNITNFMIYTLKSFNTWQITLPKARRSKFTTQNFIAEETQEGLLIKPIIENSTVYYEDKKWFGIYAENGLDTDKIIASIKQLHNG